MKKPTDQLPSQVVVNALKAHFPAALLYLASTASLLLGLGAQFAGFIVLARFLGAEQFGQLMTITAATAIALSITGLGTEEVMLRRLVREPTLYPTLLGHSLIIILTSGLFLSLLAVVGLQMLLQTTEGGVRSIATLSIFAVSNTVLARWIILTEVVFIARRQMMFANVVAAGFAIMRMLAAFIGCMLFDVDRLETWAIWHGITHLLGALASVAALWKFGAPEWRLQRDEIFRGIYLSSYQAVNNLRQNVDRLVLAAVTTPVTVGAYAVASNVVQYSFVTINSFSRLVYPEFALAGQNGVSATFKLAVKYAVVIVALGVIDSIGLLFIAPFLPWLFGEEFEASTKFLAILCWLPILVAAHNIAYDALGGAEKHGIRAVLSNSFGLVGIALIAGLTYVYGISGTLAGIFVSTALMSIVMWVCLSVLAHRDQQTTS